MCLFKDGQVSKITPYNYHICFHSYESDEMLHETVKQFFALDSLGICAPQNHLHSKEDERALEKLRDVTTLKNGRYQVGLLWKYDNVRLPNNRSMALRRHRCLTKRMEREPELAGTLRSKMADYERKGYIRKLTSEESRRTGDRTWYLPIFPVFNPNKPGKVRIVFDAAASFGGVSLNSFLMKGPDQLNDLPPVLYKFRERLIGLGGDVAEMFHQLRINSEDEDSQRIVWCANEHTMEPCDFVMQVVTFGATCSPSTALFVLNENATRFASKYPAAVDAIRHRHYVDDMLTSVDTEEQAIKLANEVRYVHQQGGFHMRNWIISDRGTNFVGADKELKETVAALDQNQLMAEFNTTRTTWRFNPPASPHMGGCWERLIQSVKKILANVKPQRVPTEEVLRNYLIQVENIVNSRPLTHVPVDDCSLPALTPNHFLLGSSDGSKPLVQYTECPLALHRSWKASEALANLYWKRWVAEYLPTITRRTKWFYPVKPIRIGDVVVIADPNFPRNCWPKGRVVSVKASADGQVRSAVVQTNTGVYERPATKLAVLDVGANGSGSNQGSTTGGDCCVQHSLTAAPTYQHH
ncbi:uncharacterized protein LOC129762368 [Toxorhynchites rutilus septentrionalis]|uniref:uncharacterized protein LOC129762368 n=1 Tax=Toxorhynchites rutilus septentrionalis TaxID=329112 RepID=UPI002479CD56|nr:uncharacterized protein LOC129762368 [Toxorhynchites rutilus septentrionalis]